MSKTPPQVDGLVDRLQEAPLLDLASHRHSGVTSDPPQFDFPAPEQLQPLFPDLEITSVIGSGGMGCVYQARQKKLDRTIALKILPRELSNDALFTERFAREARAMARLNHPGIVGIYDFGHVDDTHYLLLEHLAGANLRELLETGPIPASEVLPMLGQICDALAYAHAEGVIHRDIKPENILFDHSGRVVLADFGLARLAMDSSAPVSLTQTRQAMGTLSYMAPEQWEDPKAVDERADVYALGVLLYEMLTGRIPRGSFPTASSQVEVPAGVDDVIDRSLQPGAADRYQSVAEFSDALNRAFRGQAVAEHNYAHHGTMTNFRHMGAALLQRVPRPRTPTNPARSYETAAPSRIAWGFLILGALLLAAPWNGSTVGFQTKTVKFLDLFDTPNSLMLAELIMVAVLMCLERHIHPIRSRIASLALLGLCLAQVSMYTFDSDYRWATADTVTIYPFLFLLLVSGFALEVILQTAWEIVRGLQRHTTRVWEKHQATEALKQKERSLKFQKWVRRGKRWLRDRRR